MNYIRTSAGGMMAIRFKTNASASDKKQAILIKPAKELKKCSPSESK